MISQSRLKKLIHYDPETGVFTWLPRDGANTFNSQFNEKFAGKTVGTVSTNGYLPTSIYKKQVTGHRLAYLYMERRLPKYIDHINGIRSDNAWKNLRECNQSGNISNVGKRTNNTSGYKGVRWNKLRGKWYVGIDGVKRWQDNNAECDKSYYA